MLRHNVKSLELWIVFNELQSLSHILILLHFTKHPYIFRAMRQLTQLLENDFPNLIQMAYKMKHAIYFVQS